MVMKSCLSSLLDVITFLISVIILFIPLNPRSQSTLDGEIMSTATSNLFSWSGMLLPPLALNVRKMSSLVLKRRVSPKLFTSSSSKGDFHVQFFLDLTLPFD